MDRFEPGDSGVGQTTLLRTLVTGSTLQGLSPERRVSTLPPDQGGDPRRVDTGRSDREQVSLARHLYYSRPSGSAGGVPARRMGDALSQRPGGLAAAIADVSAHLNTQVPGLLHDKTHVFHSVEDLLDSDYARQHPFSKQDLAGLQNAEGFHDPKTGHSAIIAGNVELRPGETPHDALTRVILHERVGHDGLQTLLGSKDGKAQQRWNSLTQLIPQKDLDAIAGQDGYHHLKNNPNALAHEWFARQAEKSPHLLKKPGLLRDMWELFKEQLRRATNAWKGTAESQLDIHLRDLLRQSRKAALQNATANRSTGRPISTGTAIPLPTTSPQEIDLARKITNNLDKVQAKRPLNPREQADYDKARNLLDRAAPNHPGTRNTGNPKDLVLAGDGPISQTHDAAAEVSPPEPTQQANAVGTTIQTPGTTNPDAPTASAGEPTPPPTNQTGTTNSTSASASAGPASGYTPPSSTSTNAPSAASINRADSVSLTGNVSSANGKSKPITPPKFNKTHKNSQPIPKGRGVNGGQMQSHHGLQKRWAIHNLSKYGYNHDLAPTITLETGTDNQHTIITNLQNARRDARILAGKGAWSSTLQEELGHITSDLTAAGFSRRHILKVLEQQYSMLDKLNVPYKRIKY